jgi:NADPH-dependent ferric siderophore reductase
VAEAPVRGGRPRPQFRPVEVLAVRRLTPHFTRVTLTGGALWGFACGAPAQHIKVLLPVPGQDEPPIPAFGPDGLVFPEGVERPPMRTYTPRRFDLAALELEVDFLQHGDGPGSTWAAAAKPGDRVVIAGPGGGYPIPDDASFYVLAGDESALPAISTILEALPSRVTALAFIEVPGAADEVPLDSDAALSVAWLQRDDPTALAGDLLAATLRHAEWPAESRLFVACEATAMRGIRRHLLSERGVERNALYTRGYWKRGEANHPDHDTGEDP